MDEVKKLYTETDLFVDRKIWVVKQDNQILAFVVAEVYTNGLNFINIIDMCRVYFTSRESDKEGIINSVYLAINEFYMKMKRETSKNIYINF